MIFKYISRYIIYAIAFVAMIVYANLGRNIRKNSINDKEKFYFDRWEEDSRIKSNNAELNMKMICILFVSCSLFLSCMVFGGIESVKEICFNIVEMGREFPSIVLTVHTTLITFLGIFSKWNNEKYIAFSIEDVIKKFNIVTKLKLMTLLVGMIWGLYIISILCGETVFTFSAVSLCYLYFLIYVWYLLKVIMLFIDLLINDRIEQIMLDNLYKRFWNHNLKSKIDIENIECVRCQIKYLIQTYIDAAEKIKFENIKKIIYDTNLKCGPKTRFTKLKKISAVKCILFIISLSVWSSFASLLEQKEAILEYILVSVAFCIFIFVFTCKSTGLATALTIIFYEKSSYEISYQREKKYVKEINIIKEDKYSKFVHSLKSILAYVKLILDNEKKDIFKEIVDICKDKRDITPAVDLLIAILDYMHFCKYKTVICSEVNFDKKCKEFARAFILDIEGELKNDKLVSDSYFIYGKIKSKKRKQCF